MGETELAYAIEELALGVEALENLGLPLMVIGRMSHVTTLADRVLIAAVDEARENGATWQAIGDMLGTSKQAAFQRFGRGGASRT